jgi:hypothetical protein
MNSRDLSAKAAAGAEAAPEQQALRDALAGLLSSVAQLAVARGMTYAEVDEMLKLAFVQSASKAHEGLLAHRKVSRISTTTGINRREVTRLVQEQPRASTRNGSMASAVFAHWRTQRPYRGPNGQPRSLPRQGPKPSFESLAQSVTRDVHPRSLLDELCRLGLATWQEATDTVSLVEDGFVPRSDRVRMLGLLGDNVGDHLRASVANVLSDRQPHFEQALFADGLSAQSMARVMPTIRAQWQQLLATLVPELEAAVNADAKMEPEPGGRLRVGLYSYEETAPIPASNDASDLVVPKLPSSNRP